MKRPRFLQDDIINEYLVVSGLAFLIIVISFRKIVFSPGAICLEADWSFPVFTGQLKEWAGAELYGWYPAMDFGAPTGSAGFILKFFFYLLGSLGIDGATASKLFCMIVMFLASLSMFYLCNTIRLGFSYSLFSSTFYMLTPYVADRFCAGLSLLVIGYALLPLLMGLFITYTTGMGSFKRLLIAGLVASVAFSNDADFIIQPTILLLTCLVYTLYRHSMSVFLRGLQGLIFILLVVCLLHAHWVLPTTANLGHLREEVAVAYGHTPIRAHLSFASYLESLTLTGFHVPYTWELCKEWSLWRAASVLIPLLAFSSLFTKQKDERVVFFALLAIIGVTISSGFYGPLRPAWLWAIENFPLLALFRDAAKWNSLCCLGYAVLIGLFLESMFAPSLGPTKNLPENTTVIRHYGKRD